ncbi:hypothetical protein H4R18_004645, partial [Coemansia javaensis]
MERLAFNFEGDDPDALAAAAAAAAVDSDHEGDSDADAAGSRWAALDRELLQRIASFLPRQGDRRSLCLVNRDWAIAAAPMLWASPQFSTPEQLAAFVHAVSSQPHVHGPRVRSVRFTLTSHFDRHLTSPYYSDADRPSDAELPALLEIAEGRHVLSTDPAILRTLLHGSDLTSPPLAFKFARACSPIDCLSIYGFRLRDKHISGDMMRWRLREVEIIGMPRKPLESLGHLLCSLSALRSLRIESDSPLAPDVWGPIGLRLPVLRSLRIWAPSIAAAQLVRSLRTAPRMLEVLHLIGVDSDAGDALVERVAEAAPALRSLVVYGSQITARSAHAVLTRATELSHLELIRTAPEAPPAPSGLADAPPVVVAARLNALSLHNVAVDDALVAAAAQVATRLRTLYIRGAPCLSGEPVGALLSASAQVAAVGLHDCPLLSAAALAGLASGPSAGTVRVLLVSRCGMQSDGIERALPALTGLKHFSVVGAETVQQVFRYAMDPSALRPEAPMSAPAVTRSFKPAYPPDHYFCASDPSIAAACTEAASDLAAASVTAPPTPRTAWREYSSRRFVPGLLAFARDGSGSPGRRRATISSDTSLAHGY